MLATSGIHVCHGALYEEKPDPIHPLPEGVIFQEETRVDDLSITNVASLRVMIFIPIIPKTTPKHRVTSDLI